MALGQVDIGLGNLRDRLAEHREHRFRTLRIHQTGRRIHRDDVPGHREIERLVLTDQFSGHFRHDFFRRMRAYGAEDSQILNFPCSSVVARSSMTAAVSHFAIWLSDFWDCTGTREAPRRRLTNLPEAFPAHRNHGYAA